ncbi:hypothetical protein BDP27DRAFT_1433042 [Rhodocollybia butyracea]|uniref:Uncharacterized protein n=1 Tax=Rhodocollybia butyracea TaxID=206335 RepID=A0A9P5P8Q6_9AGAR|nr:hypothetical protein BDP27DRAFT_1433042 [Rhodocollybia butyracea]
MPASTVTITPIVKKTRASAAAAAANSGQKTRTGAAAQVVGANAPATKKEIDLKALALQQKKEAQKKSQQKAQQARDTAIRECARVMREAQGDDNDDDNTASQDLEGLDGGNDLDGQCNSPVPPLDKEEQDDQDLDGPLDEDPDALLFQETFEGSGSDNEHRQAERHGNDEDKDNDAPGIVAGHNDNNNMEVDLPSNQIQVSSPPSTPSKKASNRLRGRVILGSSPAKSSRSRSSVSSDPLTPLSRRRGGKVTEKHFTPRTRHLAILGKRMNCCATATQQPFPSDKHGYNMEILQDLAKDYKGEDDMVEVFARVLASVDTQQELVQFLGYARSSITGYPQNHWGMVEFYHLQRMQVLDAAYYEITNKGA